VKLILKFKLQAFLPALEIVRETIRTLTGVVVAWGSSELVKMAQLVVISSFKASLAVSTNVIPQ